MVLIDYLAYQVGSEPWVEFARNESFELPLGDVVRFLVRAVVQAPMVRTELTVARPDGSQFEYQYEHPYPVTTTFMTFPSLYMAIDLPGSYAGHAAHFQRQEYETDWSLQDETGFSFTVAGPPAPPAGKWYWGAAAIAAVLVGGLVILRRKKK